MPDEPQAFLNRCPACSGRRAWVPLDVPPYDPRWHELLLSGQDGCDPEVLAVAAAAQVYPCECPAGVRGVVRERGDLRATLMRIRHDARAALPDSVLELTPAHEALAYIAGHSARALRGNFDHGCVCTDVDAEDPEPELPDA